MRHPQSYLFLLAAGWLLSNSASGQARLNLRLKRELDSLEVVDQRYRRILSGGPGMESRFDSVARAAGIPDSSVGPYLAMRMLQQDSSNIRRVAQLIARYGYPGKTLVGTPTNEVALLVIQHSSRIPRYLGLVERQARAGEVPFYLYARMLDRHLMWQNKEQVYGTQSRTYSVLNAKTGQRENVSFIWPIRDPAGVNKRRRQAGFDSTVEANAQRLGIPYRPLPLAEALRIQEASQRNQ